MKNFFSRFIFLFAPMFGLVRLTPKIFHIHFPLFFTFLRRQIWITRLRGYKQVTFHSRFMEIERYIPVINVHINREYKFSNPRKIGDKHTMQTCL